MDTARRTQHGEMDTATCMRWILPSAYLLSSADYEFYLQILNSFQGPIFHILFLQPFATFYCLTFCIFILLCLFLDRASGDGSSVMLLCPCLIHIMRPFNNLISCSLFGMTSLNIYIQIAPFGMLAWCRIFIDAMINSVHHQHSLDRIYTYIHNQVLGLVLFQKKRLLIIIAKSMKLIELRAAVCIHQKSTPLLSISTSTRWYYYIQAYVRPKIALNQC